MYAKMKLDSGASRVIIIIIFVDATVGSNNNSYCIVRSGYKPEAQRVNYMY